MMFTNRFCTVKDHAIVAFVHSERVSLKTLIVRICATLSDREVWRLSSLFLSKLGSSSLYRYDNCWIIYFATRHKRGKPFRDLSTFCDKEQLYVQDERLKYQPALPRRNLSRGLCKNSSAVELKNAYYRYEDDE